MTPTTLSQINCQKPAILALLDGVRNRFEQGQPGINIFLQGRSGIGKSSIARCLARDLGGNDEPGAGTIYQTGAKIITIDELRDWKNRLRSYGFLGRQILIIDEAQHLSNDQQTALLTLLETNGREGNTIIILTAMFKDDEITGARASTWKPLKDRCIVPPLGDVEEPAFQSEIIEHVSRIVQGLGLHLDSAALCKSEGFSLRAIYARLRMESHLQGVTVDESIFLGNDSEISERVALTSEVAGRPRKMEWIENKPARESKPQMTARQKQYTANLGDHGVTILDMVARIIAEIGHPMRAVEIARKFEKQHPEMVFVSKRPRCSINASISRDIAMHGECSRFIKINRKIGLNK